MPISIQLDWLSSNNDCYVGTNWFLTWTNRQVDSFGAVVLCELMLHRKGIGFRLPSQPSPSDWLPLPEEADHTGYHIFKDSGFTAYCLCPNFLKLKCVKSEVRVPKKMMFEAYRVSYGKIINDDLHRQLGDRKSVV